MITSHLNDFDDRPVWVHVPERPSSPPTGHAVRVGVGPGFGLHQLLEQLEAFAAQPAAADVPGLVVGAWDGMAGQHLQPVVDWLVANADRFRSLVGIFLGDISHAECPLLDIRQCDPAPLPGAFPGLRVLGVRGATPVSPMEAPALERLILETCGLPREAVEGVAGSRLPALRDLELWLGSAEGGRTVSDEDLRPLLDDPPPALRNLRLRNAGGADDLAAALAEAPVLDQIDVLDLSFGTLTDDGARALAAAPALRKLTAVDLSANYLSFAVVAELVAAGLPIEAGDQRQADLVNGRPHYAPRYAV